MKSMEKMPEEEYNLKNAFLVLLDDSGEDEKNFIFSPFPLTIPIVIEGKIEELELNFSFCKKCGELKLYKSEDLKKKASDYIKDLKSKADIILNGDKNIAQEGDV